MKKRVIRDGVLEICDPRNETILSITENYNGSVFDVKLAGKIITEAAHDFEDELMACATVCKRISVDCESLTHISSMGLNTLLSLQRLIDDEPDSELRLYNVSGAVFEEFKAVGFDELLIVEKK